MKINSEIFKEFQKRCKERNLQMCTVIEAFCRQYANGRYYLNVDDIAKWKDNNAPTSTLNTPVNKEVYAKFKSVVKTRGFFVKSVLSAFIEDYAKSDLVMEFVDRDITETK
jgi:hypothetical protein